jgi:hypothetical protein
VLDVRDAPVEAARDSLEREIILWDRDDDRQRGESKLADMRCDQCRHRSPSLLGERVPGRNRAMEIDGRAIENSQAGTAVGDLLYAQLS